MTALLEKKLVCFEGTAPSNIAFVKYWGKRDPVQQWPANDSISMTLSSSITKTRASKSLNSYDSFTFEQNIVTSKDWPDHKVFRHLRKIRETLDRHDYLDLTSENTFPTGCGIASSASGFAALTVAATAALTDSDTWDALSAAGANRSQLAQWARRGSGSACRSLWGGFVRWNAGTDSSSQVIEPVFSSDHWNLADVIVVFSDQEKHTPSSEAHLAAWKSPLFRPRLSGLHTRLRDVTAALSNRDTEKLGDTIESEALEMHSVAMTGLPQINYLTEQTTNFLEWLRLARKSGRCRAWFTIDAGPNVHLICDASEAESVSTLIMREWPEVKVIRDQVGTGPTLKKYTLGEAL